ncbi:SMI1/KNR4 family protein [Streptomyces kunmingensis]|uniref:SMI1/KNR4 family protein n=1 Tax=Streptomyces kunmingensis TaxID=68225 RepID=A0ABU6C3E3_9ACTN|nr:SMI1/KNR4 family protein [Streptomyces kunmingensis]MEB3959249.1 SMI1/KNR4 family protein [Streptomyces kunmingensis]
MTPDLTRLTELLPRPQDSGQTPDWNTAETTLQTALPADYKELIDTYGGGFIDGYLLLLEPGCPNDVYDLVKISAEREEANESLWQFEDKPAELAAEGSRLVCWATTDNGEYLYWLVQSGDDADTRPILINEASGEDWERYDMTVTRFLAGVLSGEFRSQLLWDKFPLPEHEFRTAQAMAD